jgi:hypothetical protein
MKAKQMKKKKIEIQKTFLRECGVKKKGKIKIDKKM